jgi:transcriptional regulator with XRE-family HTH domain
MEYMKFSENLKIHIQEHNLSLKELALKLDVPPSTVHGWLNGIPPKSILTIKKIADLFNCSIDKLCFDEDFAKLDLENLDHNGILNIGKNRYKVLLEKI